MQTIFLAGVACTLVLAIVLWSRARRAPGGLAAWFGRRQPASVAPLPALFDPLSQNAALGILVWAEQGLLYANPAALRMAGYARLEDAQHEDVWSGLPPAQRVAAQAALQQVLRGAQECLDVSCHWVNQRGETVHLEVTAWRVTWQDRAAVQLVVRDDTRRYQAEQASQQSQQQNAQQSAEFAERAKRNLLETQADLEARLAQRTRELQQATQAKSQLLAGLSHEIRNPLNAVLGLLDLLQDTPLNPAQADYARKAQQAAKALLGVVNDVRDVSRLDAGKLGLQTAPFALPRMVDGVRAQVPALVAGKPIEVHFAIDPALPDALVGDAIRLQQVLLNLLAHAIQRSSRGTVALTLTQLQREAQAVTLRLAVAAAGADAGASAGAGAGAGMATPGRGSESSKARGLGLSLCRDLLSLMGSTLQGAADTPTGGAWSTDLRLPLAAALGADPTPALPASPAPVQAPPAQTAAVPDAALLQPRLAGLRFLLAEDHPVNQLVACAMLRAEGAVVQTADDGALAVQALQAPAPAFDAVLMDMQMPVMDGCSATRAIRQTLGMAALPIIAMTANALPEDQEACLAAGMNGFISKPVERDELVALLRQCCGLDAALAPAAPFARPQ